MDEIRISGATKPQRIADEKGIRVWIFTVPARELGLAYERHNDVLFAGNIRYALSGQTARRVRTGMLDTLQNAPTNLSFPITASRFWEMASTGAAIGLSCVPPRS